MGPYAWNTLDEAASWLSNELGNIALTARQVLELGVGRRPRFMLWCLKDLFPSLLAEGSEC